MPLAVNPLYTPMQDEYGNVIGDPATVLAQQNAANFTRQALNTVASVPATMLDRDPNAPGYLSNIPLAGVPEALAGTAGTAWNAAASLQNKIYDKIYDAVGQDPAARYHLPQVPQAVTDFGDRFTKTQEGIQQDISQGTGGALPVPDDTLIGKAASIVGNAAGAGIGVLPARVLGVLPKALQEAASYVLPTIEHTARNLPIATGIGTTLGTGAEALAASVAPQTQTDTSGGDTSPTSPVPPSSPDDARNALFGIAPPVQAQPVSNDDDARAALFGTTPIAPTFTQQGDSNIPLWAATAGGALLTTAAVLASKYTHGAAAEISQAGRALRFNDPEMAAQVQAYKNDVMTRGPNNYSLSPLQGAPVDPPQQSGGFLADKLTAIKNATVDNTAKIRQLIKLDADDPAVAERLSAMVGNVYDPQLVRNKTTALMRTGDDPVTNMNITSTKEMLDKFAAMTDYTKQQTAEFMAARGEIEARQRKKAEILAADPNATPTDADTARNLVGKTTPHLQLIVDTLSQNPEIMDVANRAKALTDGMINLGNHPAYGFFDDAEAQRLLSTHQFHVPETDLDGNQMHPFGPRGQGALGGTAQVMTHPVLDIAQHVQDMYPLFERNRMNQEMMNTKLQMQRANPNAPQSMTLVDTPTDAHASYYPSGGLGKQTGEFRDPIVGVRTKQGIKYIREDDPDYFATMSGRGLVPAQVNMNAMNTMRRMFVKGTTGVMSSITGRSIPLHNAQAVGFIAPINAPRNVRAGLLDRALQEHYGTNLPPRGLQIAARTADVFGNQLGVPASYLAGFTDRWARRLSDVLHPQSTSSANTWLRAIANDDPIDRLQQSMANRWLKSSTKRVEETHIAGAGSPITMEPPGVVTGSRVSDRGVSNAVGVRSIGAQLSPKAYFSADWAGAKPYVMNAQRAIGEAFSNVSDAGIDYLMRLNLNNPNIGKDALTNEIRNIYGNPSRIGASKAAQMAAENIPWINIGAQEASSTLGALAGRPGQTALTMTSAMGALAMYEIMKSMRSPAHMDYLQNQVTLQQREANVILSDNDDPAKTGMLFLPRSLRLMHAFMQDVMSKALNVAGAMHDPVSAQGLWEGLKDFFSAHITSSDLQAMQHAAVDNIDVVNPPSFVGHLDYNHLIDTGNFPQSVHGALSPPHGSTLPGQGADAPGDTPDGRWFRNLIANTFGAAAGTMFDAGNTAYREISRGHSYLDALGTMGHDWLHSAAQANPSLNSILYEVPLRQSVRPPIAEMLEPTLDTLKTLPTLKGEQNRGFVGHGGTRLPVPVTADDPISHDVMLHQMLDVAHSYKLRIDKAMVPIQTLKQQLGAVQTQGMDPTARTEWMNNQQRFIADGYKHVDALVNDMNNNLSNLAGKPIRLKDIKWGKDRTQFAQ